MASKRIGVVGAGIVGLAVARRLAELNPGAAVTVLEKEQQVAAHQTGRNSGVVHAGIYYPPGSLKAQLCRRGVELLQPFCEEHGIPYVECGKLVVALDASEIGRLDELERRGRENGVPGLRRLDGDGLRAIEPHAAGISGLHSPTTAITDYPAVARALADEVRAAGGAVMLGEEARAIATTSGEARVTTSGGEHAFDLLVLCAGLQSDRVARLAGDAPDPVIVPFRGEYHRLATEREHLVHGLLYPVPDPAYPFLGVHFTRRVGGGVDVGPNAVLALAREGYRRRDIRPRDLAHALASPGFRRLARRHWRMGLGEIHGSLSARAYAGQAARYLPGITAADLRPAPAGIRAQALDPDGTLVDDFRIHRLGPVVAVRNAPSPAATSALAIAEHVAATATASP